MNITKKDILLISYYFPPYVGIGGRRWAKFSKYLSRMGHTVHVLTAKNPYSERSLWWDDVRDNPRICIQELAGLYPSVLNAEPKSILDKIRYRLALTFVKILAKGTPYDRSIFWNAAMLKEAKKLIREKKISTVIVSCAPFLSAYRFIKIKKEFSSLRTIVDFRDPWTWGDILGYKALKAKAIAFERSMQDSVVENADVITVPVAVMQSYLNSTYPTLANKFIKLPHAYDPDELLVKRNYREDSFRLVFYGTLYINIGHYLTLLAEVILKFRGRVTLDIYSDSDKYREIWTSKGLDSWVKYHSPMQGKILFETIAEFDYVLFIHPIHGVHNLSTKFYEIIYCRVPIIYVGEEGETGKFIRENDLGIHCTENNLKELMEKLISLQIRLSYNTKYDVSEFSFENITHQLSEIL